MPIRLSCPSCGSLLEVGDQLAGQQVQCGGCRAVVRVPEAEAWYAPDARPAAPPVVPPAPQPGAGPDALAARASDGVRPAGPRAGGCGCLAWALGLGFLGLLLACGCGVFLVAFVAEERWQWHEPPGGGFKVELPDAPKKELKDELRKKGKVAAKGSVFGTIRLLPPEQFAVFYSDLEPAGWRTTDDQLLKDAVAALEKDLEKDHPGAKVTVAGQRPEVRGGFPARDLEVELPAGQGAMVARLVLAREPAKTRVFVITAAGPEMAPDNERAERFIKSFEITDEKLLAAQKERAKK